jgi:site-specific DNA recombinase
VVGETDLSTGDGLMVVRILAAMAANESATKSRRMKRKNDQRAAAGLPHGGNLRPFGYDQTRMAIVEDEARIIRQMVARYLAGESTRSLAGWLQESGVSTVSGKPWITTSVKQILTSERIAGLRRHRGEVVGPAAWPAIISEDEHRRALAVQQQRTVAGRRAPRRYLLSGMLRCGKCGSMLYSAARQTTRRYVCLSGPDHGGCGKLTVVAPPVEELIAHGVLYRLDTTELSDTLAGRAAADDSLTALSTQIADDTAQLEELATAYGNKDVTMREWLDAKKPIEARIAKAQRELARATHSGAIQGLVGQGAVLASSWDTLNLDRQAQIVRTVLDHAVIAPVGSSGPRKMDPNRVQPMWRL